MPAPAAPQRLARSLLARMGWSLIVATPLPRKAVLIAYPHTSNWDFVGVLIGLVALGIKARWVGKDGLFRHGLGPLMRGLGGIPVNRRENTGFIERMARIFDERSDFLLCIAPEGTRGLTEGWKSGFYHLALTAKVPVAACVLDYGGKRLGVLAVLELSGDIERDMAHLAEIYRGASGRHPERSGPVRLRERAKVDS